MLRNITESYISKTL